MKHVVRSEILDIGEYEKIREHFRARVILEKKHRRVAVGPNLTVLFENHDTVLLQIQEMLRTERITREASVLHEIETYNELLGGPGELGATVMIGVADATERDAFLVRAKGIERHLVLDIDGHAVRATWDPLRVLPDQASAVLYVKFALPEAARAALESGKAEVAFVVDHPDVALRAPVARDVVVSLAEESGDVSVAAAPFVFDRPVRFDEVDAATILFFARFFNYAHDAMEAFFGQLPGGYVRLINARKIGLPAVHVEADFKSPLRFGDVARIEVTIDRIGKSSCAFRHTMTRKHDATPVAVVKHVCAAVHLETMRSLPLPDDMRALLAAHLVPAPPPAK